MTTIKLIFVVIGILGMFLGNVLAKCVLCKKYKDFKEVVK
jgi:hypothetical protein